MSFETGDLVVNMPPLMLVRYWDGSIREGLVLALEGGVLRVAIKDGKDAYAFRLVNDTWMSEDNKPARFEFLIPAVQKVEVVDDRCMWPSPAHERSLQLSAPLAHV
jgi:hypothetical protein